MVDMDPRTELADLLADVAAYAAWQGLCGAEILPAETVKSPPQEASRPRQQPARRPQQAPASAKRPAPRARAPAPPTPETPKRKPPAKRRKSGPLPSAWASIVTAPKAAPVGAEALAQLSGRLTPNQPCPVCRNRLQLGRGEPTAAVAVVSGETLVPQGRAMLAGMLTRVLRIQPREVFFLPVNRCKTHHGSADDTELSCSTVLAEQLSAVRPQLMLALGRDASRVLFSPHQAQIRRGRWESYPTKHGPLPTLMTFHPNFLLQHPNNKGHAFADLKNFRARMDTL